MIRTVLVLSATIFLTFCRQPCPPSPPNKANPAKSVVLEGLNHPWSMAFISEQQALITEKNGDLLKVNLKSASRTSINGLPPDLVDSIGVQDSRDNSGLYEVLLDPLFSENNLIYLSYSARGDSGTTTKVIRAQLQDNELSKLETLLVGNPYNQELFHYGGGMTFGVDGKLYVTIGERYYREIDQPNLPISQNLADARGKIYRINKDGSIPNDNPDLGPEAVPGIYATGIRAAQGITLHPRTGEIWFSEHGTMQGDEINILEAGANYGWPIVTTGKYRDDSYQPPKIEAAFKDPQWFWTHTVAPTGLTFYFGSTFPHWQGDLIVPGLSRGSLWRLEIQGNTIKSAQELFVDDRVRLRKAVVSPQGKLYLLTDEDNGKLILVDNKPLE